MMLVGLFMSADYQWRPAASGQIPTAWPQAAKLVTPAKQPVLLMFLHPYCPCSRASLTELTKLISAEPGKALVRILIFDSPEFKQPANESDLWRQALTIPHAMVDRDLDGVLSRQFGAHASGTVILYDGTGQLQYSGGITAGRGHSGDNPGLQAITAALHGQPVIRRDYPVYGCPISGLSADQKGAVR